MWDAIQAFSPEQREVFSDRSSIRAFVLVGFKVHLYGALLQQMNCVSNDLRKPGKRSFDLIGA